MLGNPTKIMKWTHLISARWCIDKLLPPLHDFLPIIMIEPMIMLFQILINFRFIIFIPSRFLKYFKILLSRRTVFKFIILSAFQQILHFLCDISILCRWCPYCKYFQSLDHYDDGESNLSNTRQTESVWWHPKDGVPCSWHRVSTVKIANLMF